MEDLWIKDTTIKNQTKNIRHHKINNKERHVSQLIETNKTW